ncbi:hypothetical protein E2R68_02205 [Psychromonas sp. RZ22]|uniref:thioredoxin domain-containing protein n=1 Tax=Psychromonas algarum TaxID=2555643 RepID=UPI0010682464|nr:thioredoxin domain-containing protein [Psychromonas sp. RZ22]TEW55925.1 hypothetical protein E2R68_02205 [Psychromonas sp. RZ22]
MFDHLRTVTPLEVNEKIENKQSFVLNIVATWCSDCMDQQENIISFVNELKQQELDVVQLIAQHEKGVFVDLAYQQLVEHFGGHGYPRTVLIKNGEAVSTSNVEIISETELLALATEFSKL